MNRSCGAALLTAVVVFAITGWLAYRDSTGAATLISLGTALVLALLAATFFFFKKQRKQTADEAQQNEARLRATFNNAAMGIVEVDLEGRFQAVNNRACEILEYTNDEFLRLDVHRLTTPEDRDLSDRWNAELNHGLRPRLDYDKRYLRRDGAPVWVHVTVSPIRDAAGRIVRAVGTFEDISERKRAEEILKKQAALIDLAPAATLVRRQGGTITFWSKGAEELYGWSKEEAAGCRTDELLQTEFPVSVEAVFRTLREAGHWSGELKHHTRHGRVVVVQSSWLAQFGPDGGMSEILESNVDVTERKRLQMELERLVAERTAKLQESMAELEHFSYTITHDLRAPLRAMKGFGEVLMEGDGRLNLEQKTFTRKIINAAERMDTLITDALNYNKVVRQGFSLEPVDVEGLLREMVQTYPEFQAACVRIEIETPLPQVLGNKAGLTQCFSNLLTNAIKYRKPGRDAHVRIHGEERGDFAKLWFEDNGIGIAQKNQPQLFQMFRQVHAGYQGTGIGLALVRRAVERMGGHVGVESEEGIGSRFWLEFEKAPASIEVTAESR